MRLAWRILGRLFQILARRAERRRIQFETQAEKFFRRVKGGA